MPFMSFAGESIPIRLFLAGYELTPTMRDINKKFSVRYYLNLVLIDEEERRYFKQQVRKARLRCGVDCNQTVKCLFRCYVIASKRRTLGSLAGDVGEDAPSGVTTGARSFGVWLENAPTYLGLLGMHLGEGLSTVISPFAPPSVLCTVP